MIMNISQFNQIPKKELESGDRKIYLFETPAGNIDNTVVDSFGEEWKKFNHFSEAELENFGKMYFDILEEKMVNKNTYGIDIGCGTGRFTKYLADKIGFMEAVDPSEAIFVADKLLAGKKNVRLSMASTDNIPFDNETFDFGMSIGVLHHIPDTQKALKDCVKKIKTGGYFYIYLYYNLDNRGKLFKYLLSLATGIRKRTSVFPLKLKKITCDIIAIFIYMPFVLSGRLLKTFGLKSLAEKLPLSGYQDQTFFVIRNDALDRFGTSLEHRFSKKEIEEMMKNAGLDNITFSENIPYWHAVGKRKG
jgi:ubiquinone/menaquinone biosynthesis C-methylase UbiE